MSKVVLIQLWAFISLRALEGQMAEYTYGRFQGLKPPDSHLPLLTH